MKFISFSSISYKGYWHNTGYAKNPAAIVCGTTTISAMGRWSVSGSQWCHKHHSLSWYDPVVFKRYIFYLFLYEVVLVAHNGFTLDFTMLLSEVESQDLQLSSLSSHNIRFSDTLPLPNC